MRSKLIVLAGAALTAAAVAFSVVPASSQQPPAPTTIQLVDFNGDDKEIDLDLNKRNRFGPGDRSIVTSPLFDMQDTSQWAGKFEVDIAFIPPRRKGAFLFTVNVKVAGRGRLSSTGRAAFTQFEKGFAAPVTGGTGDFVGMEGTITVKEQKVEGKNATVFTIELSQS